MPDTKKIDLLIVDDDEDFRGITSRWFNRAGFLVSEASTGEHALELAQRRDFDVAIVDMKMPGMSGLELLKTFKEASAECEVILLTGQGTVESAVEAMKALMPRARKLKYKQLAQGAATTVWAATAPELEDLGGVYCEDCQVSEPLEDSTSSAAGVMTWALDEAAADRLWSISEEWSGEPFAV